MGVVSCLSVIKQFCTELVSWGAQSLSSVRNQEGPLVADEECQGQKSLTT